MRSYWTTGRLRSLPSFIKVHRTLDVLMRQVDSASSHLFLVAQAYIILGMILVLFLALRSTTEFHLRIMFLVSICFNGPIHFWLTRITGNVFEDSNRLLNFWKRKGIRSSSLNRKYLKSLRPIRFQVGTFCYVDRGFYISSLHFILDNVVSLLVST